MEVNQHISFRDISMETNIGHKAVLNHLPKTGYQKKLDIWISHELTSKRLMDRISNCESLLKRNEIEWNTYDNNIRKRSWLKLPVALHTVEKTILTSRRVMLSVGRIGSVLFIMSGSNQVKLLIRLSTVNNLCIWNKRLKKSSEFINNKKDVFYYDNASRQISFVGEFAV